MRRHTLALLCLVPLAACNTVPDPSLETVQVDVPEMRTCTPTSELNRVYVPAVTKTFWAITEIENPPYEPIQSREKVTREVEPARVYYENTDGFVVTEICDLPAEDAALMQGPLTTPDDAMMERAPMPGATPTN